MIKWVFVALLAINAGYLAWGVMRGAPTAEWEGLPPPTDPGVTSLVLLREQAETSPAVTPPAAAPSAPPMATPAPAAPPMTIAPPVAMPKSIAPPVAMGVPTLTPTPLPTLAATPPSPPPAAGSTPPTAMPAEIPAAAPVVGAASRPAPAPRATVNTGLPRPVRLAPVVTSVCYSFGPFPKTFLATKATVRLEEMGAKVERRSRRDKQQVGYWIYLPPLESKQAAVRKTQELKKQKVDDYFIVLASKYQNAISLGVYKNRNGAERRVAELREKGFEPRMEPRYQPINVYWLDVKAHLSERQWGAVREEYPAQRRETVTCR